MTVSATPNRALEFARAAARHPSQQRSMVPATPRCPRLSLTDLTIVVALICPVGLRAQTVADTARVADTAHVLRVLMVDAPPKPPKVDSAYLVAVPAKSQAWYVNQYLRHPYEVRLRNVANERDCRTRKVEFVANQAAAAATGLSAPTATIVPEWVPSTAGDFYCRALIHWRLGDVPGEQELNARLVRDDKVPVPEAIVAKEYNYRTSWIASAHMMPTLVAGFSYAVGTNPAPKRASDSVLVRRGQPFFGAEFVPLFVGSSPSLARVMEHVRITAATSFRSPGYDFYVGLSPIVLFDGLRTTALPIQLTAGRRWSSRGNDTYFVGGTVNALALAGTLVGQFGK